MVFLTFADNSTRDIPIEELQLIPYFKELPNLTNDSQKLDLSFNARFTYGNIIRCIALLNPVNDSCKELIDYFCIDINYYDKNEIKEAFNCDNKNINFNGIILRCKLDHTYLIKNYREIFKLPIDIIKQCITKENVNFKNNDNYNNTVLIIASRNGRIEIAKLFIDAGAKGVGLSPLPTSFAQAQNIAVNLQNDKGETALMFASERGHTRIVKLLIEAGADVNIQDHINHTALMVASCNGHAKIIKILIEARADVNLYNVNGYTALTYATANGYTKIIKLLIENGAIKN